MYINLSVIIHTILLDNVGNIANAFPAEERFQMDLRCMEYRDPVVGYSIDNYIGINGRSEAGEVHQISQEFY